MWGQELEDQFLCFTSPARTWAELDRIPLRVEQGRPASPYAQGCPTSQAPRRSCREGHQSRCREHLVTAWTLLPTYSERTLPQAAHRCKRGSSRVVAKGPLDPSLWLGCLTLEGRQPEVAATAGGHLRGGMPQSTLISSGRTLDSK